MSPTEAPPPPEDPPAAPVSDRSTVHRLHDRASYDRKDAYAVLDAGFVAHVGLATDDGPVVLPMAYARDGDHLLMHGSAASRLLTSAASSHPICVTVTHLDGLVLGRSEFRHGINYRSVVIFGVARSIDDLTEREAALNRFVEGVVPGRTTQPQPPRTPSEPELNATALLSIPLEEFSVKHRSGGPLDEVHDFDLPVWAGVIPMAISTGTPIRDDRQLTDPPPGGPPPVPDYAANYQRV